MPTDTTALGRFGHHPDPTIDFCVEVEEIDAIHYDVRTGIAKDKEDERNRRIARAMSFRVGGDEKAVAAKDRLRAIKREAAPPNPVAEVVERLRKAADNIERARMSGIVENLAGWEQRHARDAADLIERLSRERDTGVPEGWCAVPLEPTREMCEAAVIRDGGWIAAYTAPRESGVPIDGDISQEDADSLNRQSCEDARLDYIAMLSAAPQPPSVSDQAGEIERWQHIAKQGLAKCTPEHTWAEWVADRNAEIARLSAELVEARKALASTERNRDMWKGQCERQAERLTAINSLPEPCVESLSPLCQQQIDEHGVLVAVSRQAADEIYGALKVARAALSPKRDVADTAPEAAE